MGRYWSSRSRRERSAWSQTRQATHTSRTREPLQIQQSSVSLLGLRHHRHQFLGRERGHVLVLDGAAVFAGEFEALRTKSQRVAALDLELVPLRSRARMLLAT